MEEFEKFAVEIFSDGGICWRICLRFFMRRKFLKKFKKYSLRCFLNIFQYLCHAKILTIVLQKFLVTQIFFCNFYTDKINKSLWEFSKTFLGDFWKTSVTVFSKISDSLLMEILKNFVLAVWQFFSTKSILKNYFQRILFSQFNNFFLNEKLARIILKNSAKKILGAEKGEFFLEYPQDVNIPKIFKGILDVRRKFNGISFYFNLGKTIKEINEKKLSAEIR